MKRLPSFFLVLFFLPLAPVPSYSDDDDASASRQNWSLNESYDGAFRTQFDELRWKVPSLVRQTVVDLSVRTGLDYQEGWRYPLTIGFVDGAPFGVENVLAYVELFTVNGRFAQKLNINVRAFAQQGFEFDRVLAHELMHAMVNDSLGGDAAQTLPVWFHEGLAVFGANQGEKMVEVYAKQFYGFAEQQLLNGLEGPHGALDYAEDYLAFQYIWKVKGENSFRNFVDEVIRRQGDILGALPYTCFESWEDFKVHARSFAVEEIKKIGPPRRGEAQKPF